MNNKTLLLQVIQSKIGEAHLESVLTMLDRLHDAAATQTTDEVTTLNTDMIVGWLEDIIFTAQEAITELQQGSSSQAEQKSIDKAVSPGTAVLKAYRQG